MKAELTINSRQRSPRDVTHILELHYAWWERRMRDNGKEDAVGCEITRKRTLGKGGGADKRGGAHSRYQFFRCGKIGGERINDGGRSGGTLRYYYNFLYIGCAAVHLPVTSCWLINLITFGYQVGVVSGHKHFL